MHAACEILVGEAGPALQRWAVAEVGRLEQSWSRFRSDSELSVLNRSRGSVRVGEALFDAVAKSIELWRATDGLFDPTVLDALERLGYDASFEIVRSRDHTAASAGATPHRSPGLAGVRLDHDRRIVHVPGGARIDLGGIGKGLAADRIAAGLVDRGACGACVSIGGDVAAAGESPDGAWHVPVEDPRSPDRLLFTWAMQQGAVVASTTRFRRWRQGGEDRHHLVDPRTGTPSAAGIETVIVAGPDAWFAEGMAKAVVAAGAVDGVALLAAHGLTGWLYDTDGALLAPPDPERADPAEERFTCSRP